MRYVLPLLFLVLASACSTVFVELPLVVERVAVLDTVSVLENQFAAS